MNNETRNNLKETNEYKNLLNNYRCNMGFTKKDFEDKKNLPNIFINVEKELKAIFPELIGREFAFLKGGFLHDVYYFFIPLN